MARVFPRSIRLVRATAQAWWDDNIPRLGASLAYYTLFSIAPVLLVAIAIAGRVFGPDAVRGQVVGEIEALVGHDGALAVQGLLEGASRRGAGGVAAAVGSITFVLAAMGAFLELQAALNVIWRVKPRPSVNIRAFLLDRLRSFGLVVASGFLLLVSLLVSAALAAISAWASHWVPALQTALSVAHVVVSIAVSSGLFALVYSVLPDVELKARDVAVGALVTGVLFTGGQQLIGLYLGHSATASTYGAAGSVVLLLLWVYYSSQVVLLGAEFTRLHADHTGFHPPPMEFAEPDPEAPIKAT